MAPTEISRGTMLRGEGEVRFVTHFGTPLHRWAATDEVGARFAMAMLCETKIARVNEVAKAFSVDRATVLRARRRLRAGGVSALIPRKLGPTGPRLLLPATLAAIQRLYERGLCQSEIAHRVGVSTGSVSSAVHQLGLPPRRSREKQGLLHDERPVDARGEVAAIGGHATVEASATIGVAAVQLPAAEAAVVAAVEKTPALLEDASEASRIESVHRASTQAAMPAEDRVSGPGALAERAVAQLGLTPDGEAVHCFESARNVRYAGVLLGISVLLSLGVLESARATYGRLRNGVYGLRATVLALFSMALLRVKRVEGLKGVAPEALGRVLGLARAPEVKTLRRKLTEIANLGRAHELVRALFSRWRALAESALAFLYIDGHVRVYHGKRSLPKAHVAQMRLAMPAVTDYYVNDANGEPLFFVTATANEGLVSVMPNLLRDEVRPILGDCRATVVFDRGGWSPKLFAEIMTLGFDFMTYRKGRYRKLPRRLFERRTYRGNGRVHEYMIAVRQLKLAGCDKPLRLIAVLRDDGHQTHIITNRTDLMPAYAAYRMFNRWRQENYFKYMVAEFALDALVDYEDEPADPERSVPNPKWAEATSRLGVARARLAELERQYGTAAMDNEESRRPTMRGFKIAHGRVGQALRAARARCERLLVARLRIPKRVPVRKVLRGRPCVRLSRERKTFTDAVKAAAYRAEGVLLSLLRPHFSRPEDEGRALLREAFESHADLEVVGDELRVRFEPMSAARFTRALACLCEEVNKLEVCFPETRMRLRLSVAGVDAAEECGTNP